jgi:hypothetical protein
MSSADSARQSRMNFGVFRSGFAESRAASVSNAAFAA